MNTKYPLEERSVFAESLSGGSKARFKKGKGGTGFQRKASRKGNQEPLAETNQDWSGAGTIMSFGAGKGCSGSMKRISKS
jgi:hypothetical protein